MCESAIQQIVCRAVVSEAYRNRLLGSERAEVLQSSGLDVSEQEALNSIQAVTIEEFAAGVERIIRSWKHAGNRHRIQESVVIHSLIALETPPRSS